MAGKGRIDSEDAHHSARERLYRDKVELKRAALLEVLAELIMKPIAQP
jgi:hypothetical protein